MPSPLGVVASSGHAEKLLLTAKHLYDARRGSAFTDYGTGGVNGSGATNISHSGKWWGFNGSDSNVYLWSSFSLGDADERTIVLVARRASSDPPSELKVAFSWKDGSGATTRGVRCSCNSSGNWVIALGDGSDSQSRTHTTSPPINNNVIVVVMRFGDDYFSVNVNGTQSGSTTRGDVDDATPGSASNARLGNNATLDTANAWWDGDIGLCGAWERRLTDQEVAVLTSGLLGGFA